MVVPDVNDAAVRQRIVVTMVERSMKTRWSTASPVVRRTLVLASVLILGAVGMAAQQQNFDNIQVRSMHVQGKIWMLVGAGGNVTIQIGDDGVLVVDTQFDGMADKLIAEINRLSGGKPIRYIINTHSHGDHVGGNQKIAAAGAQIVAGNFAGQIAFRTGGGNPAFIIAHENALNRISRPAQGEPPPFEAWPTDTFFVESKDMYFNGEAIRLLHQPNAHTDGDILVHFRGSDVISAGDVYTNARYPNIDVAAGGSINGIVAAANNIIDLTVPADKQEGGTYVIPGHGRLADEADVVEYRDMLTIIRDRIQDLAQKGQTLEQVKAAKPTLDYDGRFGAATGIGNTDTFVERVYNGVKPPDPPANNRNRRR